MRAIRVSEDVLKGLKVIRESGAVRSYDCGGAQKLAREKGFIQTMKWIQQHRQLYKKGIMLGFECEPTN